MSVRVINSTYLTPHFSHRAQLGRWSYKKSVSAFMFKKLALTVPSIAFDFTEYLKEKKLPSLKGNEEDGKLES